MVAVILRIKVTAPFFSSESLLTANSIGDSIGAGESRGRGAGAAPFCTVDVLFDCAIPLTPFFD